MSEHKRANIATEKWDTLLCQTLPFDMTDLAVIERVQCRAIRLIQGLVRLSSEERLKETGLFTQERSVKTFQTFDLYTLTTRQF